MTIGKRRPGAVLLFLLFLYYCMGISILITTLNRKEIVAFTLQQFSRQVRPEDEIVIVDDGSSPADAEFFRSVTLPCRKQVIRHEQNLGRFYAKNHGISACSHKYVLQCDNDAWVVGDRPFELLECIMDQHPRIGALALPMHYHDPHSPRECGSLARRWVFNDLDIESSYMGCGVVLRRDAVIAAGLYPVYYQYGPEEEALAIRLLKIGYEVRGCTQARIIHGHDILCRTPQYIRTRDQSPNIDVASNQLCIAIESLHWPFNSLYFAWTILKAVKKRLPPKKVIREYSLKKSNLSPHKYKLSFCQTVHWLFLRAYVYARNLAYRQVTKRNQRIK